MRVLRTHVFVVVIVVPEENTMSGFVVWARVRRRRRIERGCVSRRKYGTMLEKRKLLEGNRRNDRERFGRERAERNEMRWWSKSQ